jgi:hypothetical protein
MYYHDDGYGGESWDDTPEDDQLAYAEGDDWIPEYEYSITTKTSLKGRIKKALSALRAKIDPVYRKRLDIPF